jgi:hypothetical protein
MSDKTKRMPNGLASPFLCEELFASERSGEAPPFSSSMIDESPFLQFSPGIKQEAEIEEEVIGNTDEEQTSEQPWDESELDAWNSFGEDSSDALVADEEIDLEDTDREFGLDGEWDADEKYDETWEEIEEAGFEAEEDVEAREEDEEEGKYVQLLTKNDAARHGDPRWELEEREESAPGFESQTGTDKTTFAPKTTDRFILLVSGYNYRDHNDDYGDLTRNRARVIVNMPLRFWERAIPKADRSPDALIVSLISNHVIPELRPSAMSGTPLGYLVGITTENRHNCQWRQ